MEQYTPPFQITNEMLLRVASISEKIGKISITNNLKSKPHLRRNNRIKSIHSSLKIEANSLSLDQVRDVINGKRVIGARKEIQEIKNAYIAYEKINSIDPYSIKNLKEFHEIMVKYVVEEAGDFRKGEEGVFNGDVCIFMCPPARLVSEQMKELFQWMKREKNKIHPLILSSIFHYEFVFIHPFADGNGRMARLWHTALLSQWKPIFEYIPIESQIEKFQEDYYEAIAKCHVEGETTTFIEFMLLQIDKILDEISGQMLEGSEHITEYLKRMLGVMEYDVPYTAFEIMGNLGLKSKETFRKNYMNPAIKLNLVKMTLPDKPNSKNQRYIKF